MPRAQNSHAYVNAGFLFKFENGGIVSSARLCFGGILPEFVHADKTEKLLVGKNLYENETLQQALHSLTAEINPDWVLPDACPDYRKNLAAALFYKFVLNTCPLNRINAKLISGGSILDRPISSGTQSYDTFKDRYPLTEKVPKYEGLIQCSGELQYVNDAKPMNDELWAAFVQATEIHSFVESINATDALVSRKSVRRNSLSLKSNSVLKTFNNFHCYRIFPALNTFSQRKTFQAKITSCQRL